MTLWTDEEEDMMARWQMPDVEGPETWERKEEVRSATKDAALDWESLVMRYGLENDDF